MDTSFAALLFRSSEVPDRALSRGFAVALAGFDVPAPHLDVAPLPGVPGWSVAFYVSGAGRGEDELEHAVELFEDELSPAVGVLDAAAEMGVPGATLLTLVFAEDVLHDEPGASPRRASSATSCARATPASRPASRPPRAARSASSPSTSPPAPARVEERAAVDRAVRPTAAPPSSPPPSARPSCRR